MLVLSKVLGFVKIGAWIGDKFTGGDSYSTIQSLQDNVGKWGESAWKDDFDLEYDNISKAFDEAYNYGDSLFKDMNISRASTGNLDEWLSSLEGLTGTDSTGGKALKVTSNDYLLSDEDI